MLWLIFAFSVYGFAGPPVWFYNVPSGSMADTLLVGDVFLAAMDAYAGDDPHRGDVAVFERNGTTYVKRVIGLPGDRVQMINGRLVLNCKLGAGSGLRATAGRAATAVAAAVAIVACPSPRLRGLRGRSFVHRAETSRFWRAP